MQRQLPHSFGVGSSNIKIGALQTVSYVILSLSSTILSSFHSPSVFALPPPTPTPTLAAFQTYPLHKRRQIQPTPSVLTFSNSYSLSTTSRKGITTTSTTITMNTSYSSSSSNNNSNDNDDPLSQRNLPSPLILGSGSFTRKLILEEMNIPFLLKVKSIDEKALGRDDREDGTHDGARNLVMTLAEAKADALIDALLECNPELRSDSITSTYSTTTEKDEAEISDKYSMVLPLQNNPNNKHDDNNNTNNNEGFIILTADQVVTHRNTILEKPKDVPQAKEFVNSYAESPPSTVGAVVLTHVPSGIRVSGSDSARIRFRPTIANNGGGNNNDDGDDGIHIVDRMLELNEPVLSCAGGLMVEHPLVKEHLDGIDGTEDSVMGLSKDLVLNLLDEIQEELSKRNKGC